MLPENHLTDMPNLLVITGTCGAGKTSVSQAWASRRHGAVISGDEIRHWIRDENHQTAHDFQEQFVLRTTITAARELLAQNLDVALDNVWFPRAMQLLNETLSSSASMRFIWLRCEATENHRRDQSRAADDAMGDRVDALRGELESQNWPTFVHVLDTTAMSCEETVDTIESLPTL
jgi:predicted kinase